MQYIKSYLWCRLGFCQLINKGVVLCPAIFSYNKKWKIYTHDRLHKAFQILEEFEEFEFLA